MKAIELMIFDLVRRKKDNRTMIVVDVGYDENIGAITTDDRFYGDFEDYHETQVEPIPITPEILEKNGFRLTKADTVCPADRYWWAIDGTRDGAMVEITLYNPDAHGVKVLTRIHTQSSHESGVNTVHSCDIESVHELQHALRLCRIDKEIVV